MVSSDQDTDLRLLYWLAIEASAAAEAARLDDTEVIS